MLGGPDLCLSQSWNWLRTATTLDTSTHLCEHNVSSRGIAPGSHEISRCLLLQELHFITRIGTQPRDAAMATAVSADLGRWDLLDLCCPPLLAAQNEPWHVLLWEWPWNAIKSSQQWSTLDLSDISWPMQVWHRNRLEDVSSAHHS